MRIPENILEENPYVQQICCCPPQVDGMIVVNAGCKIHGLISSFIYRSYGGSTKPAHSQPAKYIEHS